MVDVIYLLLLPEPLINFVRRAFSTPTSPLQHVEEDAFFVSAVKNCEISPTWCESSHHGRLWTREDNQGPCRAVPARHGHACALRGDGAVFLAQRGSYSSLRDPARKRERSQLKDPSTHQLTGVPDVNRAFCLSPFAPSLALRCLVSPCGTIRNTSTGRQSTASTTTWILTPRRRLGISPRSTLGKSSTTWIRERRTTTTSRRVKRRGTSRSSLRGREPFTRTTMSSEEGSVRGGGGSMAAQQGERDPR